MTSKSNKLISSALKKILVPHLEAEGFCGKYPQFMRREGETLHLLGVQFDKWGGGFFLEFAHHAVGDKTMPWGEVVPEEKLTFAYADLDARARLQEVASGGSLSDMWFRFDGLDAAGCEQLAHHVVALFPQVNIWLRERQAGSNISVMFGG